MLRWFHIIWALLVLSVAPVAAQQTTFDLSAYQAFLDAHADISYDELEQMHPAGVFHREAPVRFEGIPYSDSIGLKYELTADERSLIDRHGFMVTERLRFESFGDAFMDVYTKDLPVFVSTDAILHALHMSYDRILMDTEQAVLIPMLERLLADLHAALPTLADQYAGDPAMQLSLRDVDAYLTVPRTLLSGSRVEPVFPESEDVVDDLLALIADEQMAEYPLFAETCRQLDFSPFTVRGHYTREPDLSRYFQAMMWLGRTEIYLIGPETGRCRPTDADVQRQTVDAMLLMEAAERSGADETLAAFDRLIRLFVGAPDNVTLPHLKQLREDVGVASASDLLDDDRWRELQDTLAEQEWAAQRILSQILVNNTPTQPNQIQPASAFMLMGQRFVIDSYVTGSVVFDKVHHEGQAVRRMLPSTLDVLFALGNDAAAQLLEPELDQFHYADNLAALRYLVESYEPDFWQSSIYNGWLDAIRTLNPPAETDRDALPDFMQTAAWWQQKMNTQLASWAQLRHDNLLYAKQSYTGVPGCEYPLSYVEPVPAFYEAVSRLARQAETQFAELRGVGDLDVGEIRDYFSRLAGVNDTLAVIAEKELQLEPLSDEEHHFLRRMILRRQDVCYVAIDGWYAHLFYDNPERAREPDLVVADVHTTPADEAGTYVGWVLHAGTGPLDMAVVTAEVPGEGRVAFVGPVMSYYEHLSTNFKRLTDEEWKSAYAEAPSFRPEFVHTYLADPEGVSYGKASMLATSIDSVPDEAEPPSAARLVQNYPNPFREATAISFTVPGQQAHEQVTLDVYDIQGRRVRHLIDERLSAGNYMVEWDGTLDSGGRAASGTYLCRLQVGETQSVRTMTLIR